MDSGCFCLQFPDLRHSQGAGVRAGDLGFEPRLLDPEASCFHSQSHDNHGVASPPSACCTSGCSNNAPEPTADPLAAFVDRFNSPLVGVQFDIGNHQKYGPPAEWIKTLGPRIVKLDVKDWSAADGFCEIGAGDVDWPVARAALDEIGFVGWAAAEVGGGDRERMLAISRQMDEVLAV